jgi:hypothetical protein
LLRLLVGAAAGAASRAATVQACGDPTYAGGVVRVDLSTKADKYTFALRFWWAVQKLRFPVVVVTQRDMENDATPMTKRRRTAGGGSSSSCSPRPRRPTCRRASSSSTVTPAASARRRRATGSRPEADRETVRP